MTAYDMNRLLETCIALSAERDREALLFRILDTAMDLTACDGGTLYLLEHDGLRFCRMVTRSMGIRQGGAASPITLPPVPLNETHICARAILDKKPINVPDVRTDTRFDFSGAAHYDAMTGYATRSMLVFPLTDESGHMIGVLQLINALDMSGATIPFDPALEFPVSALASQAAISLTNMQYAERVQSLLDSMVRALSEAIDRRTPYNANHSRNMAHYAARFLDHLDATGHPWAFDTERRRAFLLSVLLHDVGKLIVPLSVMDKATRLGDRIDTIRSRFETIGLLDKIAHLEGRISAEDAAERDAARADALALVEEANTVGFLPDTLLAGIDALASRTYTDTHGLPRPWLTAEEHTCLTVRKGTLTAEERAVMEGHVTATAGILAQVDFPEEYACVPMWASAHHELLNGRGYPDHRTADDIPDEVRLMTILDVFDALTAKDRPYKAPMPTEKALAILHSMAENGELDKNLLALFEESRAWEG